MKQLFLFLFIFFSFKSNCQENRLLPSDSLLKVNKVKKAIMKSVRIKGNGSGFNVYYYNSNGELTKHHVLSPISNQPTIITDYFFDNSGKRYASVMHGGESYSSYNSSRSGSTWIWSSGSFDSIIYYYQYNKDNRFSRIFRNYPFGALMNESLYTYDPLTITRRSYDMQQHLTTETKEFYEKEEFIIKSIMNRYDSSGQVISTFTHDYQNTYNAAGQVTEVNYRNDTCSCILHYKYYSNGLIKSRNNVSCLWNKKFKYKYYKKP